MRPMTSEEKITTSKKYDIRAAYGDAQDSVENNLANITDDNYKTNVIVIAHVVYQTQPDGTVKGLPLKAWAEALA